METVNLRLQPSSKLDLIIGRAEPNFLLFGNLKQEGEKNNYLNLLITFLSIILPVTQ